MAPQVLRHVSLGSRPGEGQIRVDGIEATGLDDQWRLVVDRTPRMGHFARSTPELIVQRLAATAKGPDQALYADLLALFRPGQTGQAPAAAPVAILREPARPPRPAKGTRRGPGSAPA